MLEFRGWGDIETGDAWGYALVKKIRFFFCVCASISSIGLGIFSAFFFGTLVSLTGIAKLEDYRPPVITQILDIRGKLIAEFYQERRKLIDYEAVSPFLIKALLSTEDRRFPYHYGIDLRRIIKALYVNLLAFKREQGGSTITIQLSKLLFLHHKKTIERKLKEVWYALQLERQYSKKEILIFYLNQVNFGHGSYGVEAAANFFFNKKASGLSIGEAALLAGIPRSPKYYSPIRYPISSMKRHRVVLLSMIAEGYITEEAAYLEYAAFWDRFSSEVKNRQATFSDLSDNKAPYFTEHIRKRLEKDFKRSQLYAQGLKVYTTLDLRHQVLAQRHLWKALEKQNRIAKKRRQHIPNNLMHKALTETLLFSKLFHMPAVNFSQDLSEVFYLQHLKTKLQFSLNSFSFLFGIPLLPRLSYFDMHNFLDFSENTKLPNAEGAFISIAPFTGHITAMVGGSPFNYNNQFNRALQIRRQIGSTLKPFIYALALDSDILTAATLLKDRPVIFGEYLPKNYSGKYRGSILMRTALVKSVNICAVETLNKIGIEEARKRLSAIFRSFSKKDQAEKFPPDLTMALGSGSFSPISLATAYAVLANEGNAVRPYTIRYITDHEGKVIRNYEEEHTQLQPQRLLDARTAFIIADIIKGAFKPGGTAYIPDLLKDFKAKYFSYGKTGTASNWKDAWFAGANSFLSAVVWIGYDNNASLGKHRNGGKVAAPVWIQFMKEAIATGGSAKNNL